MKVDFDQHECCPCMCVNSLLRINWTLIKFLLYYKIIDMSIKRIIILITIYIWIRTSYNYAFCSILYSKNTSLIITNQIIILSSSLL